MMRIVHYMQVTSGYYRNTNLLELKHEHTLVIWITADTTVRDAVIENQINQINLTWQIKFEISPVLWYKTFYWTFIWV